MKPDLNLLVVLDALCRAGSVSRAADLLALSQPAVSHALARLRALTGDPLFLRKGRGLTPTPRALGLAQSVAALVAEGRALLGPESFDPSRDAARFRIGTSDYAGLTLLPDLVADLRTHAPLSTLEAAPIGPDPLAALEYGTVDLCFWGTDAPGAPYRYQPLFGESFVAVLRQGHPAISLTDGRLTLAAYLAVAHAVVSLGDPGQSPVDLALAAAGLARRIVLVSPSFAANLATVAASDLIAAVPSRLGRRLPQGLVALPLPFAVPDHGYGILWHPLGDVSPAQRWLRARIRHLFASSAPPAG